MLTGTVPHVIEWTWGLLLLNPSKSCYLLISTGASHNLPKRGEQLTYKREADMQERSWHAREKSWHAREQMNFCWTISGRSSFSLVLERQHLRSRLLVPRSSAYPAISGVHTWHRDNRWWWSKPYWRFLLEAGVKSWPYTNIYNSANLIFK